MTASKAPEELRRAIETIVRREYHEAIPGAVLDAIEARYPGCWETLRIAELHKREMEAFLSRSAPPDDSIRYNHEGEPWPQ